MKLGILWLAVSCAAGCSKAADGGRVASAAGGGSLAYQVPQADASNVLAQANASNVDAFGCPLPSRDCGCMPVSYQGSWFAQQLQNCQLAFTMQYDYLDDLSRIDVVVACNPRPISLIDADAGFLWQADETSTPAGTDTAWRWTLTLPDDICEIVKNNSGARVDVFAGSCSIAIMCGDMGT